MTIITKNKTTTGAGTDPLEVGELAVNTADLNLYVGTAGGNEILIDSDAAQIADGTAEGQVLRWDDTGGEWETATDVNIDTAGNVGIGTGGSGLNDALVVNGNIAADKFIAVADNASAPAHSWSGDPDTGMFRLAEDTLAFTTAGVAGLRQNATQDVGIGVNPVQKLDVGGNIRLRSGGQVLADADGDVGAPAYTFNGDVDTGMFRFAANTIGFATNGAEMMRINTTATFVEGGYSALDRVAGTASSVGQARIHRFLTLTQSQYDSLTPDTNTLYIIV